MKAPRPGLPGRVTIPAQAAPPAPAAPPAFPTPAREPPRVKGPADTAQAAPSAPLSGPGRHAVARPLGRGRRPPPPDVPSLRAQLPPGPAPLVDGVEASVRRALADARGVPGASAASPCSFWRLRPEAADRLAPPGLAGLGGGWVLVTCRSADGAERQAHLRERCLTAVQRFMLSLSCDGVENAWHGVPPDARALRQAGVDVGRSAAVGLVRYG